MLVVAAMVAGSIAPVNAAGVQPNTACKIYTNPAKVGYMEWQNGPGGGILGMGYTGTLYTGDSSSGCNDINISNVSTGFGGVAEVAVQYLSGGVWHNDSQYATDVPVNSSKLVVIGRGYANNTPFRVLISVGVGNTGPWPNFKLYV